METNRITKKIRTTLYMTKEDEQLLYEIFINRLKKNKKTDKSALLCEALKLLYQKEILNTNTK